MFFTQYGLLFSGMEWYVLVLFIVGLAFLVAEFLQPGFGALGISGTVFLVLAIIFRAVFHNKEDDVLTQLFQFLLTDVLIIGLFLTVFFVLQKKGLLKKGVFNVGTAVDEKYSDGTENYSFLVGKKGKAETTLRPCGKAEIEGKIYDVVSKTFLIEKGKEIIVINAEGGKIEVTTL